MTASTAKPKPTIPRTPVEAVSTSAPRKERHGHPGTSVERLPPELGIDILVAGAIPATGSVDQTFAAFAV